MSSSAACELPSWVTDIATGVSVLNAGYLEKRGHYVTAFRRRLCVLLSTELRYYKEHTGTARGSISLKDIKCVQSMARRGVFELSVGSGRVFYFAARSDRDRDRWVAAINQAQFAPSMLAVLLRQVEDMRMAGLVSEADAAALSTQLLGSESVEALASVAEQIRAKFDASVAEDGSCPEAPELDEMLARFAEARDERTLVASLAKLHKAMVSEEATQAIRQRVIDAAIAQYGNADGRWTAVVQQAYRLLLQAMSTQRPSCEAAAERARSEAQAFARELSESALFRRGSAALPLGEPAPPLLQPRERSTEPGAAQAPPSPALAESDGILSDDTDAEELAAAVAAGHVVREPTSTNIIGHASGAPHVEEEEVPAMDDIVSPGTFQAKYELGSTLGEGGYSVVHRAVNRSSGKSVAVKLVTKQDMSRRVTVALLREVRVIARLQHPNIVQLLDFYDEPTHYIIVTELMEGGELFERIVNTTGMSERRARDVVVALAQALLYMHERGLVHRDLKPENVLLSDENDTATIKLADFGFARHVPEAGLTTACGTPSYVAPEILRGDSYGVATDCWSLGVIMYILLCGHPPFIDQKQPMLFRKIKSGMVFFDAAVWASVSEPAKDLIRKLLTVDVRQRATAAEVLSDPWVLSTAGSAALSQTRHWLRTCRRTEGNVLKAGLLQKQGQLVPNWKVRLFELTRTALSYKDPESKQLCGEILLSDVEETLLMPRRGAFSLRTKQGRALFVECKEESDARQWTRAIHAAKAANDALDLANDAMATNAYEAAISLTEDAQRLLTALNAILESTDGTEVARTPAPAALPGGDLGLEQSSLPHSTAQPPASSPLSTHSPSPVSIRSSSSACSSSSESISRAAIGPSTSPDHHSSEPASAPPAAAAAAAPEVSQS